jgi:hypothetical protein
MVEISQRDVADGRMEEIGSGLRNLRKMNLGAHCPKFGCNTKVVAES